MTRFKPILSAILVAGTLSAADLEPAARKVLLDHLNQSSSAFSNSIKGLTNEQWNYKPAPEVWSIAECAEHIALSEDFLREMVESRVLTAPPSTDASRIPDEKVLKMITDRSFKAQAPEPLKPTRQFSTPQAALEKFEAGRKKTIALAKSRNDLREHSRPHPALKDLDAYQWLLYISGHTMRHTDQIREVKSRPEFPK